MCRLAMCLLLTADGPISLMIKSSSHQVNQVINELDITFILTQLVRPPMDCPVTELSGAHGLVERPSVRLTVVACYTSSKKTIEHVRCKLFSDSTRHLCNIILISVIRVLSNILSHVSLIALITRGSNLQSRLRADFSTRLFTLTIHCLRIFANWARAALDSAITSFFLREHRLNE